MDDSTLGNWRVGGKSEWPEIKAQDTGEYFFPDCSYYCIHCDCCVGCIRKQVWDGKTLHEKPMHCMSSPTGWHEVLFNDAE